MAHDQPRRVIAVTARTRSRLSGSEPEIPTRQSTRITTLL